MLVMLQIVALLLAFALSLVTLNYEVRARKRQCLLADVQKPSTGLKLILHQRLFCCDAYLKIWESLFLLRRGPLSPPSRPLVNIRNWKRIPGHSDFRFGIQMESRGKKESGFIGLINCVIMDQIQMPKCFIILSPLTLFRQGELFDFQVFHSPYQLHLCCVLSPQAFRHLLFLVSPCEAKSDKEERHRIDREPQPSG